MVINFSTSSRTIISPARPSITLLKPGGTTPHAHSREVIIFQYQRLISTARASPLQQTGFPFGLMQLNAATLLAQGGSDRHKPRQVRIRGCGLWSARQVQYPLHPLKNVFRANQPYTIFSAEGTTASTMGAAWTA